MSAKSIQKSKTLAKAVGDWDLYALSQMCFNAFNFFFKVRMCFLFLFINGLWFDPGAARVAVQKKERKNGANVNDRILLILN